MVKEKVTLGNERVSQEMAGWNAFSLLAYLYDCVGIPIIPHLFSESGFHVSVESYVQFSVII